MEVVSKWLPFTIDGITHKKHILTSKPINFAALTDLSCVICSIFIALLIAAVITHLHEDVGVGEILISRHWMEGITHLMALENM